MHYQKQGGEISTTDFAIAAYLMACGEEFTDFRRIRDSRGKPQLHIVFDEDAEPLIRDYFNGATLPAIEFKNAMDNARTMAFNIMKELEHDERTAGTDH